MANVIPEEMRRDGERRFRARYILAGAIVAVLCAGIAFLALLPSYLTLIINARSAAPSFAAVTSAQRASDAASIAHSNALLAELSSIIAASSTPAETIAAALALRPAGVRIDQIIYRAGAPSSLMLSGAADTNSAINAYQTALAADPRFTSVSVPVGALVGTDGGRFSVTLSGVF